MPWQPSSKRCSVSSAASSHHKGDRRLCGGFARVNERLGSHMGMDELIDLFAEGDELVSNTAFEDLDLAYDVANGATFDGVVFRSCEFDGVETVLTSKGRYCATPVTHHVKLGKIVELLHKFAEMPKTLMIPDIPADSFAKRLFSTYLSYLPKEKAIFDLKMNCDNRGSFAELVHTLNCGQVSINISKPGITKGEHWHHTKWEQFIVVSGHGLIQLRNENDPNAEVLEYEVSGDHIQSVIMLPGYTHNIINLSNTQDLVTVMYCNEIFNPERPDTYFDKVDKE